MSTPTLGSITVGADLRVEVPVTDMGGNAAVRVDYAVSPTEPAEASHLWRTPGSALSPSSVFTPVQLLGTLVWVRASGRNATGTQQTSAFTVAQYIEVADIPRFLSLTVELTDNRVPVLRWDPSALNVGVRVSWVLHDSAHEAGSFTDTLDVEAVYGEVELPESLAIGEAITLQVEAWDGFDSDTVTGHMGEVVERTLVRRAVTTELDELYLRSPDGGRWQVTVSNSGDLVVALIS